MSSVRAMAVVEVHSFRLKAGSDEGAFLAADLAQGAQSALRWTKHTLNHWYRQMAPAFDASLAYEFYGFGGPDAAEGVASHREKRPPSFSGPTSE